MYLNVQLFRSMCNASDLVSGYNSDIICLQECDTKVFEGDLVPALSTLGFKGVMREKGGVREGSAIFFRESKFRLRALLFI